jgi:hypothetical protein
MAGDDADPVKENYRGNDEPGLRGTCLRLVTWTFAKLRHEHSHRRMR